MADIKIVNPNTATLSSNLQRQGRYFLFDPLAAAVTGTPGFVDFGYMPPDAKLLANNAVNRTDVPAANREGGPDVILASNITSIAISYDVVALTPDQAVQNLHAGTTAVALAEAGYPGAKAYSIDPSLSIPGRGIIVRKRQPAADGSRIHTVVFHPRMTLAPNGTGDSNGEDTMLFTATVQAFNWVPTAAFAELQSKVSQYGAVFEVPDAQLAALLGALDGEALPA